MRSPVVRIALVTLVLTAVRSGVASAQGFRDVEITPTRITDGIFMLEGRGGNIGVSIGDDGVFMIDDQFAPLAGKIREAVAELSDEPIRFVLNTHWHGDHTGGNESFGDGGAILVAHENVRKRLSVEQFMEAFNQRVPASPTAALPVITFSDGVTFHLNGDEIRVFHVEHAHTDGDAIIHFAKADVMHLGDTFFNGTYPFIDVGSGGSIDGMIAAADACLERMGPETRLIPGHGPLGRPDDLRRYRSMLVAARSAVGRLVVEGRSREEAVAAKPTADLDEQWGGGFMTPDQFVGIVHDSLTKQMRQ